MLYPPDIFNGFELRVKYSLYYIERKCERKMKLDLPEELLTNMNLDRFKSFTEALEYTLNLDLDIHKIVDDYRTSTPAELRQALENVDVLISRYAGEAILADMQPITPYTGKLVHDAFYDVEHCNNYIKRTNGLKKLTSEYFTGTEALVADLYQILDKFFADDLVYHKKFPTFLNQCVNQCLVTCARYDNNDTVKPLMARAMIKECMDDCMKKVTMKDHKGFCNMVFDLVDKDKDKYDEYYRHAINHANNITTEAAFQRVYDYAHGLDIPESAYITTEAINSNKALKNANEKTTRGGSGAMKEVKDTGYAAYRIYKKHEENYDNQATKLAQWMKKLVFGDKREQIIEGKTWTPISVLKKALGTVAIFSINPIIGIIGTAVLYATDKRLTYKERMQILTELENEQKMIQEKIEDAKSAGDNQAKYALMRTDNELTEAIKKIRIAAERSGNAKAAVRQVLSRGSGTGA